MVGANEAPVIAGGAWFPIVGNMEPFAASDARFASPLLLPRDADWSLLLAPI